MATKLLILQYRCIYAIIKAIALFYDFICMRSHKIIVLKKTVTITISSSRK